MDVIVAEYGKYGIGFVLAIYVIKESFNLIGKVITTVTSKKSSVPDEKQLKETSRVLIQQSADILQEMKPAFFDATSKCKDIHKVITESDKGVPLVYNKGLEDSIVALNFTIQALSESITQLGQNCHKNSGD